MGFRFYFLGIFPGQISGVYSHETRFPWGAFRPRSFAWRRRLLARNRFERRGQSGLPLRPMCRGLRLLLGRRLRLRQLRVHRLWLCSRDEILVLRHCLDLLREVVVPDCIRRIKFE